MRIQDGPRGPSRASKYQYFAIAKTLKTNISSMVLGSIQGLPRQPGKAQEDSQKAPKELQRFQKINPKRTPTNISLGCPFSWSLSFFCDLSRGQGACNRLRLRSVPGDTMPRWKPWQVAALMSWFWWDFGCSRSLKTDLDDSFTFLSRIMLVSSGKFGSSWGLKGYQNDEFIF